MLVGADAHIRPLGIVPMKRDDVGIVPYGTTQGQQKAEQEILLRF